METADVYGIQGGSEKGEYEIFFYFVLNTKIYPGDGFVFIFNSGEWSSSAGSTDRLRKAPSVSVVSLEVAAM